MPGKAPLVNCILMNGVIMSGRSRSNINLLNLEDHIEKAFKPNAFGRKPSAVALIINSPGGSAVQSALITNRIRYLSKKYEVPTLSFAEDVAASGGYWLLCAAEKIYATECSMIGSIGVISGGFGLQESIKKLGIERRIYTAGKNKSFNDPFQESKEEDVIKLQGILDGLHRSFIQHIKSSRGGKLAEDNYDVIFNADIFLAPISKELGLIDEIYTDRDEFLKNEFGDDVKVNVVNKRKQSFFSDLLGVSSSSSNSMNSNTCKQSFFEENVETGINLFMEKMEEKILKQRYGL